MPREEGSPWDLCKTSFCAERGTCGQATIEAAALLPTLMLLLGLLLQPACLLYTRSVMQGAAAEAARLVMTSDGSADADCRDYVLRRLEAVPEVPLFHVGGRGDWQIEFTREAKSVGVKITGHLRPLPLLGVTARALGETDATGVVLVAEVKERMRPAWLGGSYETWVGMWG